MRTRRLPLIIPQEDYKQLEELAKAHERDPLQQARWMLRQALNSYQRDDEWDSKREAAEYARS